MDSQPQFVIHSVAGDKEYLQGFVAPVRTIKKFKNPQPGLRELKVGKWR
jgi:hypothetical protein